METKVILFNQDKKLINELLEQLKQCGKVHYGEIHNLIKKDSLVSHLAPYEGGYFSIVAICSNNMYEWLNGFCTGYLAKDD
jgi:hypothetical protein